MRIAVFGGLAPIPSEFVVQAMEAGHTVTWFIGTDDALPDPALETDYGEILRIERGAWDDDINRYCEIVQGSDAVFVSFTPEHFGPLESWVPQQKMIQHAMLKEAVKRIVLVTMHGAGDSARRLDWAAWARLNANQVFYSLAGRLSPCWSLAAQYSAQEQVVSDGELDWTVLRPTLVTDGPATNTYLASAKDVFGGYISAADVVDCALKALVDNMDVKTAFSIAYSSRVA
ncbi:hypothetical protein IW140_005849 [Coemansia sp. RSA 1813]|nr:hypothetical protein EV178_002607 [Coemansia sp. RSA 1646]KAJ1767955.1 hypothetical protein LPJ74_005092 [Coemansia sp. RSA 1843]KAJ2086342.1 hypothetical protein IW138_005762 [Coemansia sp. RSA 986]KAJ2210993.1 hypothetical protein EV179_005834 [Coemansia sp. RSA 487]KAJ2564146.1 hypothetical protein IW140_005849 [Coemansia sp. RSA 1813]